jgi:uncharacterized protein YgiB involved in biofilm formation
MLKRMRKSSARVTLVLIGVASLAGCDRAEEQRRDVYATRDDCLADWGKKPEDCTPATEARHSSHGFWYGPSYGIPYGYTSGSSWTPRSGARAIGSSSFSSRSGSSSSVSRGGFGSSSHSSGG